FHLSLTLQYLANSSRMVRGWRRRIIDSILVTVREAEKVFCDVSLRNKVVVVFHLTNFISTELLSTISKELKYNIMQKTQEAFFDFYKVFEITSTKDLSFYIHAIVFYTHFE